MRRILLFGTALFLSIRVSPAATCGSASLASYLVLGSGGCTIGSETLSNFQIVSGQAGATAIAPGSLSLGPGGGGSDVSLTFTTNQTANTGSLLEAIFTYEISGASFTSSAISLMNSSETVDGAVAEIENFCAGGSFGPDGVTGCTGTAGSLLTLDGFQNSDQSSITPTPFVNVTNDFTLDGGTAGSASGGVFTNTFTATTAIPEPCSLLLSVLGVGLVAGIRVRILSREV